jgi:hypothetical protein
MPWAARRRLIISILVGALVVAFLALISIATFYKTPSCSDGVQNQGEAGIDCGGSCAYLCSTETLPPTVLFTKALISGTGRTDIVASIENKNPHAVAKAVPYRVQIYGPDRLPIGVQTGSIDLPPGATVPVFLAGIATGKQPVASAFLEIDPAALKWVATGSDPRVVPTVSGTVQSGSPEAPRIEVTLKNGSVSALSNVRVIVFVRDVRREIIAASQTIVPFIGAQSSATATFTWNSAFPAAAASIEAVPIIPLP